jgi:hypothetical protein
LLEALKSGQISRFAIPFFIGSRLGPMPESV